MSILRINSTMKNFSRQNNHHIVSHIINRYSYRKFSNEAVNKEELFSLFEAARWAPSAMNNQLWHYCYAQKNTKHWQKFFDLLAPGNQEWCCNASALIILLSRKEATYKNKPQPTHSLESGMSLQNLAIEATARGIIAHPMAGFDYEKATNFLKINNKWKVECMVAIGRIENNSTEEQTDRKPLSSIVSEGIPTLE